ncbi:MAG: hypothetical protein WB384_23435 [Candidatus Sulfotelmatobacter sp.]
MHTWQNLASAILVLGAGQLLVTVGYVVKRIFRYCRHNKMGWPIRQDSYTYQACLDCGIERLFDENRFQPYGRYSRNLKQTGAAKGL